MNNQDTLQRFLFENMTIRGEIVHLSRTYQEIIQQHDYPPVVKRLLGEALVLISLLAATIKFTGRLSLQFQNKSGLKLLLVQSDQDFHLRALAQWEGEIDEEELLTDMKKGILVIMMDQDQSTQRYQGVVSWRGDSLAQSIEGYFQDSEQLKTRIWVAIDEERAAGLLLQMMPQLEESKHDLIETDSNELAWEHLVHLTNTVKTSELLELETEVLLHRLYVEEDVRLFESEDVTFRCTCSAKRGENAILLLGQAEAEEELSQKQVIVVKCDFCNREFVFDKVDVATIFRQGGTPPSSTQIH
jgi:molecular chaperone Hsp33